VAEASHAVFLSYASQDAEAAQKICEALRAAGIEVWFDQSELRGGDAWDRQIREQINECALFVPVISANAHARIEGYFRLEWKLGVDRSHRMAPDQAFLLPVVIDDTPQADKRTPDRFRELQWTRLPGGDTTPAFVERVRRLLSPSEPDVPARRHEPAAASVPAASRRATAGWRWKAGLLAVVAAVMVAVGYVLVKELWLSKHPATEQPVAVARVAPANGAGATPIPEKSIAVLPFTDMSEKKNQEYFSDGLSEELIDKLSQIPDLRVPAQTSSFYFKGKQATVAEIAKALSVAHILEGSVRKSGNHLRISAQLIRADSGYNLWSETYDRQLDEIFKVQDEIAAAVVGALKVRLLSAQPIADSHHTSNADAYNDYLLGRNFYLNRPTRDGPRLAIDAYRKAIELDPGYGLAYAGLAEAESLAADEFNDVKGQERALADAERAVLLAPNVADVYGVRGHLRHTHSWDWVGAQADFEKAVALNGREPVIQTHYAELLATVGQLSEAVAATRKATEIDPLSELASRRLGQYLYCQGDLKAAREALSLALALNPESIYSRWHFGVVELLDGHPQQALVAFQQDEDPVFHLNGVALAEHSLGHTEAASAALDQLIRTNAVQGADYQIAEVYAWRADRDHAFEWLERALARRDGGLIFVKIDPLLASLHSDPRYKAFLRKMNLPE